MNLPRRLTIALCGIAFLVPGTLAPAWAEPQYLGPVALAAGADGRTLYVACRDGCRLLVVDVERGEVVDSLRLPAPPTGLALGPQGRLLCATCAADELLCATCAADELLDAAAAPRELPGSQGRPSRNCAVLVETAGLRVAGAIPAGHGATAPVISPDARRLYVCNRFDDDVSVVDLQQRRTLRRMPAGREPIAAALSPDGRRLLVANHLPADAADRFYVTATVQVIDTRSWQTTAVRLPDGSTGVRGISIDPQGRYAFVTHILANYQLVPAQVVGGWTNTNVLSIVDVRAGRFVNSVQLDELGRGAANPWGVACSADGRWLCVAHAGTHELSVIDLPGMLAELRERFAGRVVGAAPHNPSSLGELRQRIALDGRGPRAVAVCGDRVVAATYFSDTLEVVPLGAAHLLDEPAAPGALEAAGSIALGPRPRWTPQRRGELLFNDAIICYQHWQSCASCHPDGRTDALNWDLTNDGVGNPKNTKSMLLAHRTPPAMSTGVRPDAEAAVRAGLEHILFAETGEEEAAAIDVYLRALVPVPNPAPRRGEPLAAALRGRAVFEQLGCADCHPAPLYTDQRSHEMGTQNAYDQRRAFDTPTLVEVWRTAPYLHDGRYATLEELLREGKHGLAGAAPDSLSEQQLRDLVRFVRSL